MKIHDVKHCVVITPTFHRSTIESTSIDTYSIRQASFALKGLLIYTGVTLYTIKI